MTSLTQSLKHWNTPGFETALKAELASLDDGVLPLQLAATHGGMVDGNNLAISVISTSEAGDNLLARVGIFFTEVVGGCSCGDEPFEANAYCVLDIRLDKSTGVAQFVLHDDA